MREIHFVWLAVAALFCWGDGLKADVTLENFHKVATDVYRSARSDEHGLQSFVRKFRDKNPDKKIVVISLENGASDPRVQRAVDRERALAGELGIRFKNYPMGYGDQDLGYLNHILDKIEQYKREGRAVLIHCYEGKDRTGLIVALYRSLRRGEDPEWVYRDMLKNGFHAQGLKSFRRTYEKALAQNGKPLSACLRMLLE